MDNNNKDMDFSSDEDFNDMIYDDQDETGVYSRYLRNLVKYF